jgi:hypothetical protein
MQLDLRQPLSCSSSHRRGKIARLPYEIREQLNTRLDDGQEADQILPWLNTLPQVRQITADRFNSVPVSPQNLSAWRQGAFQEWLLHRELIDSAAHIGEQIEELQGVFNCVSADDVTLTLSDYMITQLTTRFNTFLARWNGGPLDSQTATLLKIGHFILKLQQSAYRAQRQAIELPRLRRQAQYEHEDEIKAEIYSDLGRAKREQQKPAQSQKTNPPQNPPPTKDPVQPPPPAAAIASESSPIKPNQASRKTTPPGSAVVSPASVGVPPMEPALRDSQKS